MRFMVYNAMSKMPLKPDRPLASIVFPNKGNVYNNREQPPRTQEELEFAIGKKFLNSLAHFRGEHFEDLNYGPDEPADLVCKRINGDNILIQVAEVVDLSLITLKTLRKSYLDTINEKHKNVMNAFSGCSVELLDLPDLPYLPELKTKEGKRCSNELVTGLKSIGSEIESLQVRKMRGRKLSIGVSEREIHILIERFATSDQNQPYILKWNGNNPVYQKDNPRVILSETVSGKIEKSYAKPKDEFWLLAYATDTLIHETDPDIHKARNILVEHEHVFDCVFYIYPYPNKDLGHLIKVWPTE
jgi:hypothetical protein